MILSMVNESEDLFITLSLQLVCQPNLNQTK